MEGFTRPSLERLPRVCSIVDGLRVPYDVSTKWGYVGLDGLGQLHAVKHGHAWCGRNVHSMSIPKRYIAAQYNCQSKCT